MRILSRLMIVLLISLLSTLLVSGIDIGDNCPAGCVCSLDITCDISGVPTTIFTTQSYNRVPVTVDPPLKINFTNDNCPTGATCHYDEFCIDGTRNYNLPFSGSETCGNNCVCEAFIDSFDNCPDYGGGCVCDVTENCPTPTSCTGAPGDTFVAQWVSLNIVCTDSNDGGAGQDYLQYVEAGGNAVSTNDDCTCEGDYYATMGHCCSFYGTGSQKQLHNVNFDLDQNDCTSSCVGRTIDWNMFGTQGSQCCGDDTSDCMLIDIDKPEYICVETDIDQWQWLQEDTSKGKISDVFCYGDVDIVSDGSEWIACGFPSSYFGGAGAQPGYIFDLDGTIASDEVENPLIISNHDYICSYDQNFNLGECCGGTDYGRCTSDPSHGYLRGKSFDISTGRYYCTEYGDWTTDLDEIFIGDPILGNDPSGLSCKFAELPNGTLAGFFPTKSLCCGDDGINDIYSDPLLYGDACYKGQIVGNCEQELQDGTVLPNIYNKNGTLHGCNYQEPGNANIGVVNTKYCTTLCGDVFCSYNGTWSDGGNRNTNKTWILTGSKECCEPTQCWNGNTCIDNQANNPNSPPQSGYRCIDGAWLQADLKTTPTGLQGYCSYNSQCLYDLDTNPRCYDNGNYKDDFYCENGNWSTRTKLLALQMLGLVGSSDYTIFCGNYADVLNHYDYTSATYNKIQDYFDNKANKICVLEYSNKIIIGTTLNQDINSANYPFLEALGKDKDYCDGALMNNGNYNPCDNDDVYIYYNNELQSVIYSKSSINLGNSVSFWTFIENPISNIALWVMNSIDKPPDYDYSFVQDRKFFDRLYINKLGSKKITAIIESPTQNKKFIAAEYSGFGDACLIINDYVSKKGAYEIISCQNNKVVTRDFTNVHFVPETWNVDDIWKDLTSKLRIK